MYIGGTMDRLIGPALVSKSFAMTGAPKYLVMLKDAGHFSFTELSRTYQATIAAYAIGFFDKSLRAKPVPLLDRPASGQVAQILHRP
jgi:predicted dienelactone hydrolase